MQMVRLPPVIAVLCEYAKRQMCSTKSSLGCMKLDDYSPFYGLSGCEYL